MAPSRTGRLLPPPEATTPACTLPCDLLLEIVARSDVGTVVRSAATCKPLRRDILSPDFIRRVCQHGPNGGVVPAFLVGYLRVRLVLPGAPSDARRDVLLRGPPGAVPVPHRASADYLGRRYMPLTSRNGLAVLCRGWSDICVYNPMTGNRAYLPRPLDVDRFCRDDGRFCTYVLLTAADGIGCPFLLLATNSSVSRIQTVSSDVAADGTCGWGPVISVDEPDDLHRGLRPCDANVQPYSCAVVLNGLIHWLMCIRAYKRPDLYVLTYDVPRHGTPAATTAGSIEVPKDCLPDRCERSDLHLTSSPDGRLCLLVADRFTISIWLLSGSTGRCARLIDTEPIVRSASPHELPQSERPRDVDFVMRSTVVEERRSPATALYELGFPE